MLIICQRYLEASHLCYSTHNLYSKTITEIFYLTMEYLSKSIKIIILEDDLYF